MRFAESIGFPLVLKADGLAAGKAGSLLMTSPRPCQP